MYGIETPETLAVGFSLNKLPPTITGAPAARDHGAASRALAGRISKMYC